MATTTSSDSYQTLVARLQRVRESTEAQRKRRKTIEDELSKLNEELSHSERKEQSLLTDVSNVIEAQTGLRLTVAGAVPCLTSPAPSLAPSPVPATYQNNPSTVTDTDRVKDQTTSTVGVLERSIRGTPTSDGESSVFSDEEDLKHLDHHPEYPNIIKTRNGWVEIRCPFCHGSSTKKKLLVMGLKGMSHHLRQANHIPGWLEAGKQGNEDTLKRTYYRRIHDFELLRVREEDEEDPYVSQDDPNVIVKRIFKIGGYMAGVPVTYSDETLSNTSNGPAHAGEQPGVKQVAAPPQSDLRQDMLGQGPGTSVPSPAAHPQPSNTSNGGTGVRASPVAPVANMSGEQSRIVRLGTLPRT